MPIDWSKYGVGEENPKGSSSSVSRIDWDKYKTPAVDNSIPVSEPVTTDQAERPKKTFIQKVGQALADFPNAFNSSTSFGLTDAVGRLIGQETKEEQAARDSRIGGKIGNIAGYVAPGAAIDQAVVRLGGAALKSLPKVAQGLVRGTAAGTLDAAAQEAGDVAFRGREFDPLNVAIGGGAGGVLGGAAPLIGQAFQKFVSRSKSVSPELEQATRAALENATPEPVKISTLRPLNKDQYVSRVMGQIKDEVYQRMTPPLENPNELAKWLRPHLGEDVSLNEIKKLGYEGMRQLAEDVRINAKMHDVARQVARERGIDLDGAFAGNIPSVRQTAAQDASRRAYGVYPESLPGVRRSPSKYDAVRRAIKSSQTADKPVARPTPAKEILASAPEREAQESLERVQVGRTVRTLQNQSPIAPRDPIRSESVADEYQRLSNEWGKLYDKINDIIEQYDNQKFKLGTQGRKLKAESDGLSQRMQEIEVRLKKLRETPVSREISQIQPNAVGTSLNPLQDTKSNPFKKTIGAINELGDIATGGMNQGMRAGGKSSHRASPTISHIVSSARREKTSLSGVAEKSYIDMVDDIYSLKKTDDLTASAKGRSLKPTESAHELALQSRGSAQQARQIMKDKLINAQGEAIGDSLKDVLKPIGKKQLREFEDYMLNRHAITRFERGEQVFDNLPDGRDWTPEIGREIVKQYDAKYPQFAEAAKAMRQFDDQFNQAWRVDTGMLKPEVIKAWKEQNPDYINMNRYFSELEKSGNGFGAKRGLAGQKDPTKKYNFKGSKRKIIRPIESKIRAIDAAVKASNRNRSMQALVKNIEDHPEVFKGIAEIVPEGKGKFNLKDIDLTSPDGIDEMMLRFDDAYENVLRSTRKDLDNVVPVMMNGEPVYVRIQNKNLLEAVTSINGEAFDSATKLANHLTNAWKAMLTGINPVFTLTRSVLRDPVSAFVQSKSTNNPIRFISDLTRGAWEVMRNGDLYKEYKRLGGGFNSPNVGTPKLINRTVRDIVPSDSVMEGIVTRFGDKLLDTLNRIESVPRLGEYKRLTGQSLDDKLNALRESREVAVNFQRKGRKGRVIDAYFPYFNAAIQSIDKLGRSIKDRPGSTLAKIGMSVTTPSVLLYMLNADNPDYQKLSENEKDRFLHIPLGNGRFFRYPVPQELIPFTSLPRRILQQVRDKDPKAWNEFGSTLVQNIVPPGIGGSILGAAESGLPGAVVGAGQDTFAGPIFDVASNKTWTGAPIVPGYLEGASRKNQMNERTTSLAKKVANLTGGSPMQIDYLIRQYGGDLGNIVTSLIDKGALKAGAGLAEGIGKRLVVDANLSDSALSDFYDLKEKFDKMYKDYTVTGEVPKGYNDATRKQLDNVARGLSDISTAMREIDKSSLSDKEKKAQKRELTIMRNKIAREAYKALR